MTRAAWYAIVALVAVAATRPARTHGDAAWIQAERRYVDREAVHCSGPADCRAVPCALLLEDAGGIEHDGQRLAWRDRGLYWSAEPAPPDGTQRCWACVRGGVLRCLFRPQAGS